MTTEVGKGHKWQGLARDEWELRVVITQLWAMAALREKEAQKSRNLDFYG